MDIPMAKGKFLLTLQGERASWEALLAEVDISHMTQPGVAGEWSMPEEILITSPSRFKHLLPASWPDEPLSETIASSYEHYQQHIPDIRAWLSTQ
jgi:hypothetical protein